MSKPKKKKDVDTRKLTTDYTPKPYVVMRQQGADEATFKVIHDFTVTDYNCGLRAGDSVRLIKDLQERDHEDRPTEVRKAGEEWTVLKGSTEDPGIVWFRQPDGEMRSWDDEPEIFELLRVVSRANV